MTKQLRMKTRAPHGEPQFTERISFYCTEKQKKKFLKMGRSVWMRRVLDNTTEPKVTE